MWSTPEKIIVSSWQDSAKSNIPNLITLISLTRRMKVGFDEETLLLRDEPEATP